MREFVGRLKGLSTAQLTLNAVPFANGEIRRLIPTWIRSSGIGICVGILRGAGVNIAAFLTYNSAKNASDDKGSFGKGNPQGVAATRVFAQIQRLPGVLLVPSVLVLMCVGVYVINGRPVDLWIMLGAGLVGYFLEKLNVPLAPIILGMILGPMAEQSVRRTLLISRGDATELLSRPISTFLALATVAMLLWPLMKVMNQRRLKRAT